jgi:ABC-type transport system involved in multi-copper enzyme maturation permease subunit
MSLTTSEGAQRASSFGPHLRWLVACELRKTTSTSAWWALMLPAALLSLAVGLVGAGQDLPARILLVGLGYLAPIFALLFGVVCVTAESRHNTIASSYLVAANRTSLVVAKLATAALVGAGYAVVCAVTGVVGLLVRGVDMGGDVVPLLQVSAGSVLMLALWAALGVGLGSLVRSQLVAVLLSLLYLLVGEPIIVVMLNVTGLERAARFLPSAAATATLQVLGGGLGFGGHFGIADPWWLTLLVFAGYLAVIVLVGTAAARRRDIT